MKNVEVLIVAVVITRQARYRGNRAEIQPIRPAQDYSSWLHVHTWERFSDTAISFDLFHVVINWGRGDIECGLLVPRVLSALEYRLATVAHRRSASEAFRPEQLEARISHVVDAFLSPLCSCFITNDCCAHTLEVYDITERLDESLGKQKKIDDDKNGC